MRRDSGVGVESLREVQGDALTPSTPLFAMGCAASKGVVPTQPDPGGAKPSDVDALRTMLESLDADGDGMLTRSEFVAMLTRPAWSTTTPGQAQALYERCLDPEKRLLVIETFVRGWAMRHNSSGGTRLILRDSGELEVIEEAVERDLLLLQQTGAPVATRGKTVGSRLFERAVTVRWLKSFVAKFPKMLTLRTYEVVTEVVIPQTLEGLCRLCELPNVETGAIEVFVSHSWGARFSDLFAAICDTCPNHVFVWLDLFAVLQHSQMKDGTPLPEQMLMDKTDDLKFDKCIEASRALLLVCNPSPNMEKVTYDDIFQTEDTEKYDAKWKEAEIEFLPPQRVWCCYEILYSVIHHKPMVVCPGVADPASDAIVPPLIPSSNETVLILNQLVDIERAQAKYEADKSRILSDVKERVGISKTNALIKGAMNGAVMYNFATRSVEGDYSPVLKAVVSGDSSYIKNAAFTKEMADVALSIAVAGNYLNIIKVLTELGADPNAKTEGDDTAMLWAASGGHIDLLEALQNAGADLSWHNTVGWGTVPWAAYDNHDRLIELFAKLKQLGQDVAACGSLNEAQLKLPLDKRLTNMSPVMWMTPRPFFPALRALIKEYDSAVDTANAQGLTALMFAAAQKKFTMVKELVDLGADVNKRMPAHDQTAAMWAARHGQKETLDELVKLGASLNLRDADGKSANDLLAEFEASSKPLNGENPAPEPPCLGAPARTDVRCAVMMYNLETWLIM